MAPRYTYKTTRVAQPPDADWSWRLAHVVTVKSYQRGDAGATYEREYVWEHDARDDMPTGGEEISQ
jgi:hypothetical protein